MLLSCQEKDAEALYRRRVSKSAPVGVISKVLRILDVLNSAPAGLQLRFIVEETGLNKSTAYRFLTHLEAEGYLFRDDSGAYLPGPMLLRLGSGPSYQMTLRKISRSVLQDLRNATGETVNLGILNGRDVFYVDVLSGRNAFSNASRVGSVRPVYCTAMGKVLIAALPLNDKNRILASLRFERFTPHTVTELGRLRGELGTIQRNGYAIDDEESAFGVRCVSVPILLEDNKLLAAVSIAGSASRMVNERVPSLVDALQDSARSITNQFRQRPLDRDSGFQLSYLT